MTPAVDLHLRALMDAGGVLLVNLAKGRLGEDSSAVPGGLLVSTLGLAGLSRADAPASEHRPFFVYADEFQTFTTLSVVSMMSELRKYAVGLTLAHQHLAQLEPEVRSAVLGNAGMWIVFRVGAEDAPIHSRELAPDLGTLDLINLSNRNAYMKLMIDGSPCVPFSGQMTEMAPDHRRPGHPDHLTKAGI